MTSFEIFNIQQLISEADICLSILASFESEESLVTEMGRESVSVVRIHTKSYSEFVSLDDVFVHTESGNMFMYYDTFVERFAQAKDLAYSGTYKCLYDGDGNLFAIAIGLNI